MFRVGDRIENVCDIDVIDVPIGFEAVLKRIDEDGFLIFDDAAGAERFRDPASYKVVEAPMMATMEPDHILTEQGRWVHIMRPFDAPHVAGRHGGEVIPVDPYEETLRDRFAMSALTGLVHLGATEYDNLANAAYELADAMMAERERGK